MTRGLELVASSLLGLATLGSTGAISAIQTADISKKAEYEDYRSEGCYADSKRNRIMTKRIVKERMSAEICFEYCNNGHYTHFGTQQGDECWCAEDPWLTANGGKVSSSECDMKCKRSDKKEKCGGRDRMSVYKMLPDDRKDDKDKDDKDKDDKDKDDKDKDDKDKDDKDKDDKDKDDKDKDKDKDDKDKDKDKDDKDKDKDKDDKDKDDLYKSKGCYKDDRKDRLMSKKYTRRSMSAEICYYLCEDDYTHFGTQDGDECWCGKNPHLKSEVSSSECNVPCARSDTREKCGGRKRMSVYEIKDKDGKDKGGKDKDGKDKDDKDKDDKDKDDKDKDDKDRDDKDRDDKDSDDKDSDDKDRDDKDKDDKDRDDKDKDDKDKDDKDRDDKDRDDKDRDDKDDKDRDDKDKDDKDRDDKDRDDKDRDDKDRDDKDKDDKDKDDKDSDDKDRDDKDRDDKDKDDKDKDDKDKDDKDKDDKDKDDKDKDDKDKDDKDKDDKDKDDKDKDDKDKDDKDKDDKDKDDKDKDDKDKDDKDKDDKDKDDKDKTPPYKGCYADKESRRAMPHEKWESKHMTIKLCVDYCSDLGYKYAGAQSGKECWCGDKYDVHGKSTRCHMPCAGNRRETCGGRDALSVYKC